MSTINVLNTLPDREEYAINQRIAVQRSATATDRAQAQKFLSENALLEFENHPYQDFHGLAAKPLGYAPLPISGCKHSYIYKGTDRFQKTSTCDAPIRLVCGYCNDELLMNCGSRKTSECEPCELRYRSNVRTTARMPLMMALPGSVILLTLTAPGAKKHCLTHTYKDADGKIQPSVRCETMDYADEFTGEIFERFLDSDCVECPCSKNSVNTYDELSAFNYSLPRKWNDFITYARRAIKFKNPLTGDKQSFTQLEGLEFYKTIETQERGALHIHALIRLKGKTAFTPQLRAAIADLAMRHGFGHQVDIQVIGEDGLDAVKAARYIAKYVSKQSDMTRDKVPYPEHVDEFEMTREVSEDGSVSSALQPVKHQNAGKYQILWEVSPAGAVAPLRALEAAPGSLGKTVARRRRKRLPRAYSVSAGWGLSLRKLKDQQRMFFVDPLKARLMMFNFMLDVWRHQDPDRYTYNPAAPPLLALTTGK